MGIYMVEGVEDVAGREWDECSVASDDTVIKRKPREKTGTGQGKGKGEKKPASSLHHEKGGNEKRLRKAGGFGDGGGTEHGSQIQGRGAGEKSPSSLQRLQDVVRILRQQVHELRERRKEESLEGGNSGEWSLV